MWSTLRRSIGFAWRTTPLLCVLLVSRSILSGLEKHFLATPHDYLLILLVHYVIIVPTLFWYVNHCFDDAFVALGKVMLREQYERYQRTTYAWKQTSTPREFSRLVHEAVQASQCIVQWGLSQTLDLVCNLVVCAYKLRHFSTVTLMAGGTFSILLFGLAFRQQPLEEMRGLKLTRLRAQHQRDIAFNEWKVGLVTAHAILDRETTLLKLNCLDNRYWRRTGVITKFGCHLMLLGLAWSNDFLYVLTLLLSLVADIEGVTRFVSELRHANEDVLALTTYWASYETTLTGPSHSLPLLKAWPTPHVDLRAFALYTPADDRRLLFTSPDLHLEAGSRYLLRGSSGCGKSLWLESLAGWRPGVVCVDGVHATQWAPHVVLYSPRMAPELPDKDVTLRDVFGPRASVPEMERWLGVVEMDEWMGRLGTVETDIQLGMSSGEKARVTMAVILYRLFQSKTSTLFIVDEPEQSLDPDLAYRILKRLVSLLADAGHTWIVVSHLERLGQCMTWTQRWVIEDGQWREL